MRIRKRRLIIFAGISVLASLLAGELAVWIFDLDWRYIRKLLYYQDGAIQLFQHSDDPRLLFRPKPGTSLQMKLENLEVEAGGHVVRYKDHAASINSLGLRGKEVEENKREGVFRIACYGGSNVFGDLLNDDETWPARLDQKLNGKRPAQYEVLNFGVKAYVGSQIAIFAEETAARFKPDMVFLALSNTGSPAFLYGAPVEPFFEKDPYKWHILFPEDAFTPSALSYDTSLRLIEYFRLFRFLVLGIGAMKGDIYHWCKATSIQMNEEMNVKYIRKFIVEWKERTKLVIFLCPAVNPELYKSYFKGLSVPVFALRADDMPLEYSWIHPPPYVMEWYAERLYEWMLKMGYVEGQ